MKKFVIGLLVGIALTISGSVFAEDGLEKITAYLRKDLPIKLDGQQLKLQNPPIVYDGSTYVPLRELSGIVGVGVEWNDKTQTVELSSKSTSNMTISTEGNEQQSMTQSTIYLNGRSIIEILGKKYPDNEKKISLSPEGLLKIDSQEFQLQFSKEHAGFLITPLLDAGIIGTSDLTVTSQ